MPTQQNTDALIAAAKAFRDAAQPDISVAPGSMIGLWLRTADALAASETARVAAEAKLAKVAEWANRFQVGDTWDSIDSYDLGAILSEGTPTETRDTK